MRLPSTGNVGSPSGIDVDFSLGLINHTGAYYLSRDLVDSLQPFIADVYFWRFRLKSLPRSLTRVALARLMLAEYHLLRGRSCFEIHHGARKTLYLDPLFVLRSRLTRADVVLCHDVGPITHPDLFDPDTVRLYRRAYAQIESTGPGLVFVSEASRSAFVDLFGSTFRFLRVITLYPRRELHTTLARAPHGVEGPFILAVGAQEHRKNYPRIMDAYSRSAAAASHSLVICGPRGNAAGAIHAAARSYPGVRVLGSVRDDELSWLYQHAEGFCLPSLLEGFGVPVIEAAERGLVCVTSAGSAQEEALGGHGIFVDPTDTPAIVAGINRLITMTQQDRRDCVSRAAEHTATLTRERFLGAWADLMQQELATAVVARGDEHQAETRVT